MDELEKILSTISAGLILLPIIVALINFKLIKGYLRPVFLFLFLGVVTDGLVLIFKFYKLETDYIAIIYSLVEFSLISIFYALFFRSYFKPHTIYIVLTLFFVVSLVLFIMVGLQANNFIVTIECFVFTCYSLFLFYFIMKNLIFENLLSAPVFWFNTGVLLYFTGNLCIFIFSAYVSSHATEEYRLLWRSIHTFFNILMNIFFTIGFWKLRAK